MHCLTVCSAWDRCVLLQALFQCLMYLRIMQMTWEIHEYVCIWNKIHQHASKESSSTNEARNKTSKQQRLWNNHISRYVVLSHTSPWCGGRSLHYTKLELRPKVRNTWAFLLFANKENIIYHNNIFTIKILFTINHSLKMKTSKLSNLKWAWIFK